MTNPFVVLLLAPPEQGGSGVMIWMINLGLIFLIFYWLLIRPQRKEQERHRKMIEALKKGDQVVTVGGIMGTIVHVAPDRLTLKTGDNTRIVVERTKVGQRLEET